MRALTTMGTMRFLMIPIAFLFGCIFTLNYTLLSHSALSASAAPEDFARNGLQGNIEETLSSAPRKKEVAQFTQDKLPTEIKPKKKLKPPVTTKHQLSRRALTSIVSTPIIVVGMMKAGTTSIFRYFKCGLHKQEYEKLTHYDCNPPRYDRDNRIRMSCGGRMRANIDRGVEAFNGMDQFLLYAEIDAQEKNGGMTLSQWDYLQQIHSQFPTATFILNVRDPKKWIKSIDKWKDLRQRFIDKHIPPILPRGVGANDTDLENFYLAQAQRVRDFVSDHPSHELVELPIDSPDAGQIMQDYFGIYKECWGDRNSNVNGTSQWRMD